jgi:hypothetical protein
MTVRPASDADAWARWDRARDCDDPFGTAAYARALGLAGVPLLVCGDDDGRAALVAARSTGPFRRAFVPPLTPYTPVALGAGDAATALARLADGLADTFDDVVLLLSPAVADVRALQWAGWTVEPRHTYWLDPSVAADPGTWSENPRRTLRQHGSAFRIEEGSRFVPDVASLCAASYGRHDRSGPLPEASMRTMAAHMAEAGQVRVLAALDPDDAVRAGVALLCGTATCYYWMAGSEPGPAMTVLLASVFRLLADDGVPVLDLVGANTPSIAEFKRRFGPDLVRYHMARRTPSRILRLAVAARSAFRS